MPISRIWLEQLCLILVPYLKRVSESESAYCNKERIGDSEQLTLDTL